MIKLTTRLAAIAGAAALLAACGGQNVLDAGATAKYVRHVVSEKTGFSPADVKCPSDIPATVGRRLNCHFTGPDARYTAYLRIESVHGRRVFFRWKTQPSSWPAPALS
jgi:hypothetical protein